MDRILVTTGNGMFGNALITALAGRKDIEVRAMVRDRAKFGIKAPNVEVVTGDMDDPATLVAPLRDVTQVFLTSPMGDRIAEREMAVLDAVQGSPRIISIHGAVDHAGDALEQQHVAVQDRIRSSGLPWSVVSPSSVMETSFDGYAQQLGFGVIFGMSGRGRIGFVALDDVTRVLVEVVTGAGHEGRDYVCTGPAAVDMPETVAALSAAIGREIDYVDLPEDEFADMLLEHAGFADRDELEVQVLCHLRAWKEDRAALVTDTVEKVTGRAPVTVQDWFTANADRFRVKQSLMQKAASKVIKARYGGRILR